MPTEEVLYEYLQTTSSVNGFDNISPLTPRCFVEQSGTKLGAACGCPQKGKAILDLRYKRQSYKDNRDYVLKFNFKNQHAALFLAHLTFSRKTALERLS